MDKRKYTTKLQEGLHNNLSKTTAWSRTQMYRLQQQRQLLLSDTRCTRSDKNAEQGWRFWEHDNEQHTRPGVGNIHSSKRQPLHIHKDLDRTATSKLATDPTGTTKGTR